MKDEELTEKKVSSTEIYKGAILDVRRDDITLPDGAPAFREYICHKGAVCVLPLTGDGQVILVRQYRYAVGKILLEAPAGKLDSVDEIPREAALRELREETGATCERLTELGLLIPSPAILSEKIHMYLAEGLSFGETDFDDDEFLEIVRLPLADAVDMVLRGEIEDAKTQAILLKVKCLRDAK